MKRLKYSVLGAMFALALLSAVSVASASAEAGIRIEGEKFVADSYPESMTAQDTSKSTLFATPEGNLSCDSVSFTANLPYAGPGLGVTADSYKNCSFAGFGSEVNMNGCIFIYTLLDLEPYPNGAMTVGCPKTSPGIQITQRFAGYEVCTTTIKGTSGGSGVTYWSYTEGGVRKLVVWSEVSNLPYTNSGPACSQGAGTFNDGSFTWVRSFFSA